MAGGFFTAGPLGEGPKDDFELSVFHEFVEYQYMAVRTVAHEISLWFVSGCLFQVIHGT